MSRRPLLGWLLWIAVILVCCFPPAFNYFKENHEALNKDYDIWYEAGRAVCEGRELYVLNQSLEFDFMYPPAAAVLLAPLTIGGKLPFIVLMVLLNSVGWIASVWLGLRVATGRGWNNPEPLITLPIILTFPFVWITYHLGQPNLQLLACLLAAALCLQIRRPIVAGFLIALATAIKAFPILAGCYLVYRRHWLAVAGLLVGLALWLLILPASVRGWSRNWNDLQTWSDAMLRNDSTAIGQRVDVAYRWKNRSLLASCHRLLRHVPADMIKPTAESPRKDEISLYINLVDLDFKIVNRIAYGLMLIWGVIYIFCMPSATNRTERTDALEFGMLLIMIIACSPISWFYYGVWLLFPFMLIVQAYLESPAGSRDRTMIAAWLAASMCLLFFFPDWNWFRPLRSAGTPLLGHFLLFAELAWLLRRRSSTTPTPGLAPLV